MRKIKNFIHLGEALIANIFYGFPSRKIRVIGITGTDGKTTTTSLIYHILRDSGVKAAMVSTVGAYIGKKTYDTGFHVTTPSSFALQKYIKKAVDTGNNFLILEVTSHSLDQNRVYGVKFDIGVLTNITHEHLDYHKTYKSYVVAKMKLLNSSIISIINRDDDSYKIISNLKFPISKKMITYGFDNKADINPQNFSFETNLIGDFNNYNALAAVAVCKELNLSDKDIRNALKTFKPPVGRQEVVHDGLYTVMIDFAHTPNAFSRILSEIAKSKEGRLIHVFGSAGRRDAAKRPLMGKESSNFSDIMILTSEDPRDESIDQIYSDIEKGIKKDFKLLDYNDYKGSPKKKIYFKINDRKEAIKYAISIAEKKDFIVITGKSHEKSMNYGNGEEPWDEFKAVENALEKK